MEFVEPEDEPGHFRNPLPPDDRLWRHPSEMGADDHASLAGTTPAGAWSGSAGAPPGGGGDDGRPSLWLVAAVSAVSAGLIATGLVLVVVGLAGNQRIRAVVERQMEPRPVDAAGGGDGASGDVVTVTGRARAAIVQIRLDGRTSVAGSGVVFRSDGHVLTTASVVGRATTLRVRLDNGRELTGRVVGTDPDTDIAVVELAGDGPFPTAVLGLSTDLRVGQQAIVIGCPVDLTAVELVGGPSATVGMISALHRSVRRSDGGMLFDMVQTDARVPTGWPGGALLDSSGSVVGITTAVGNAAAGTPTENATDNSSGGFGFAVPIELARSVADRLIADGRVAWVWLGVHGDDLDWVGATSLGVPGGAVVADVMAGSPAARAGLVAGDVILGLDGVAVTAMDQLVVALRRHQPGETVRVDIVRDQQPMSMGVVLVERPVPA